MKFVEIYKLKNDGNQEIIGICRLGADGIVVCEGDTIFCDNLRRDGIIDYSSDGFRMRLFPKDGIKFLENLKFAFRSGYLVATEVK